MKTSIPSEQLKKIFTNLQQDNAGFLNTHPGESPHRQPVHTVYGGAQLYKATTTKRIGELALASLKANAPTIKVFSKIFGIKSSPLARQVYARVEEKLKKEAVEDFRIDFEDGFGYRPDDEEDATALATAKEVASAMKQDLLPPFIGIRIKTLSEELKARGLRTLDIFLTTLLEETKGALPSGFAVTLPKITGVGQVRALIQALAAIEKARGLKAGTLKMELMVETPQSIFGLDGECVLPSFVAAAEGRCVAAHFGTYDYTASLQITARHQVMDHPSCDFAKHVMQVSLAGTGVWLSDGATNVMPVGIHRTPSTKKEKAENMASIHRAWQLSYKHNLHSLRQAFYQGWDLHPTQLPVRYAALYEFFLSGLESASARLKNFIEQASKATLVGDIFDDAATGQGLLNYFLRAMNCGAITEREILATGLTLDEIRSRSFKKILEGRTKR